MKSKIKKSVIPFGAIIAVALVLILTIFTVFSSNTTFANDNSNHKDKMLTIYDRGTKKVIITNKSTIGDALKEAGIQIDEKDVIEPAVNEELIASDYQVNIYRARPVVIIDGNSRTKITTAFQTARQIIESAGIKLYDEDKTEFISSSDIISDGVGLQVVINRATPVNLTLFGKTTQVRTHGNNVREMLKEKNIKLSSDDRVLPTLDTKITDGMDIKVWREGKQIISVEEQVEFDIEKIEDVDREVSYQEIKVPGQKGLRNVSYEITIQDGVEVSRTEIASITTLQPKTQVELVGIKGKYTTPSENENITWDFLIKQGFSKIQTAGIMGNLMQEHGFETSDTSGGLGIVQWTGGRRYALISKPNYDNIYIQLDFLMEELNGGYWVVRDNLKASKSLEESVKIFQNQFERCGICMEDQRIMYAQNILASHN